MKWLIFGGHGWIGTMVVRFLEVMGQEVIHATSRADDDEAVHLELDLHQPNRVMCLVGRTHGNGCGTIDYLEQKGKLVENVRDNLYAPVELALSCRERGIHLTYLGTGCIFTYDDPNEREVMTEEDRPNFTGSSYSTVKGFTDRLMHHPLLSSHVLNVRIRMPIVGFHHPRNFITKIVQYEKVCSLPNSMTVLDDMIPVMVDLAGRGKTGTYHLTNPGVMTHNEILELYREYVDPAKTWENFTLEEQDSILASKRSNNELSSVKLLEEYPNLLSLRDSLTRLMKRWK